MLKSIRINVSDARVPLSIPPSTFFLPFRARYFNSTAQIIDSPIDHLDISKEAPPTSKIVSVSPPSSGTIKTLEPSAPHPTRRSAPLPPTAQSFSGKVPVSDSVKKLLPLLLAQSSHFITAHLHGKPYLLTQGDTLRLPFRMPGVVPGDVLRLNRATSIGSRDYTLKGSGGEAGYLDERIFECRAVVVGTESEPVRVKEKTKRRNRRVRTVKSKHKFTVLRVSELRVRTIREVETRS